MIGSFYNRSKKHGAVFPVVAIICELAVGITGLLGVNSVSSKQYTVLIS